MLLKDLRRDLFSVQGGADPSTKHMVYFNEWGDLDDSPVSYHITEVSAHTYLHRAPTTGHGWLCVLAVHASGCRSCGARGSWLRSPLHVCTVRVCFLRFSDIALAARLYSPWTPARRIPGSGLWAAASTKRFVSAGFCGNIYCAVNLPLPWNANHFGAYFNFGGERDVPLGGPHIIDAVKPCLR